MAILAGVVALYMLRGFPRVGNICSRSMTSRTGFGCALEDTADMAGFALDALVRAIKRISCLVMIEGVCGEDRRTESQCKNRLQNECENF